MGLFDDVAGAVKGALLQGGESGAQGILSNVLQNSSLGGLGGVLQQLNGAGLGNLVSSWTGGAGQGQPISVDQLKGALTPEHIQEIASSLNLSPENALSHLAEHLPMLAGKA